MSIDTTDARSTGPVALDLPRAERASASEQVAWIVSQAASPPVLVVLLAYFAAAGEATVAAFGLATVHVALVVVAPMAYLIGLLRNGVVGDLDVFRREERWRPFLATVGGAWIAWGVLCAFDAPAALSGTAGVLALEVALVFAITLLWKISLHCTTAAVAGTLVWEFTGDPTPLFVGAPLMIWSRLVLRRHTPAQTLAGSALGWLLVTWGFELLAGSP